MEKDRALAAFLAAFAAMVAIGGPWRYVWSEPLCIFEPCEPGRMVVVQGIMAPGAVAAGLCIAAILAMLLLPRLEAGRAVASVFLGLGIAWSVGSAALGTMVIFGEDLGAGWAPMACAGLSLAAIAVLYWRPLVGESAGSERAAARERRS